MRYFRIIGGISIRTKHGMAHRGGVFNSEMISLGGKDEKEEKKLFNAFVAKKINDNYIIECDLSGEPIKVDKPERKPPNKKQNSKERKTLSLKVGQSVSE
jgi:hypothetical protein